MKKIFFNIFAATLLSAALTGCGNDFLDTEMSNGLDLETALNTTANVGNALNGTYYNLFYYQFAGNYSTTLGDLASDITYWNGDNSHQDDIYRMAYTDTSYTLEGIWEYGYKVVDNAARVINAAQALLAEAEDPDDIAELNVYMAEAYALRAYAYTMLANTFCHQPMVAGQSYADRLGLVLVDKPIGVNDVVSRATVGDTWKAIVADLEASLAAFDAAGGDRGDLFYWGIASTKGLMARVQLYLENYNEAYAYAAEALAEAGITELTYSAGAYHALYNYGTSNTESLFALAIDASNNWSANSCGTLFSTYCMSPAPKLMAMYGPNDVRLSVMDFAANSTPMMPVYAAGKFACYAMGNSAMGTCYIINAPEMFLIKAEAAVKKGNPSDAADNLLVVAHRNPAIASTADLPSDPDGLMAFIKDERARELFQEGHRLWDLRRWDERPGLFAIGSPDIAYTFNNVKVSDVVFPIPASEINTHAGVEQNPDWNAGRPK